MCKSLRAAHISGVIRGHGVDTNPRGDMGRADLVAAYVARLRRAAPRLVAERVEQKCADGELASEIESPPEPSASTPPPSKKVAAVPTSTVPANQLDFREHIERGLRARGCVTAATRREAPSSREGCENWSRYLDAPGAGLVGDRSDLVPALPDLSPEAVQFAVEQHDAAVSAAELRVETRQEIRELVRRGEWRDWDRPAYEGIACTAAERDRAAAYREQVEHWTSAGGELVPQHHQPNRDPGPGPRFDREWRPHNAPQVRPLRAAMWRLRDALRPLQTPRVTACGRACIAKDGHVAVVALPDGRVVLQGLAHCTSVWECPGCQMSVLQGRAAILKDACQRHGQTRIGMMTLTVRHGYGDDLKAMRVALAAAFRRVSRHRVYRDWVREAGVVGRIRAIEVTHGPNGWHPHLHILFFFDRELPTRWRKTEDGYAAEWDCPRADELFALWERAVEHEFGRSYRPSREHGIHFARALDGEYISKLGLELTDPGHKSGRKPQHRTPLQIASDWADEWQRIRRTRLSPEARGELLKAHQRHPDAELWRTYCAAMRGARRLVWSHGLKAELGVRDVTDADLACDDDDMTPDNPPVVIHRIAAVVWREIRDRLYQGELVHVVLCTAAEHGGAEALRRTLLEVVAA